ncbi:MAG TPA: Trp biosynthesis-associated membrane protein, partial [Jatrophihabitans sp.]|nr:Trp biosynthesis-associated membrane protein [Jatrophihabitans sp.]
QLQLITALLLDVIGAAGALLAATRHWQTVTTPRPAPLHDDVLALTGRDIDAAPTALALVALAGVVAVIATRGWLRRVVGAVLALSGVGLVWRAAVSAGAVSAQRARALVTAHHPTAALGPAPHVQANTGWAVVTVVCGVLVTATGTWIAWRGHTWQVMSARYEAHPPAEGDSTKAAATLWNALDRGEDPTH